MKTKDFDAAFDDGVDITTHLDLSKTMRVMQKPFMNPDIVTYNTAQAPVDKAICDLLALEICKNLPEAENKIWHAHPVWFLEGNPVAGYSKLKGGVRLLFWSGQSFEEPGLKNEGSFKAAEARFSAVEQVDVLNLARWLAQARDIQWDYKNIVKRKGKLDRLK